MADDYLWDGRGVPDPEVQRLEQLLGTLQHRSATPFDAARAGASRPRPLPAVSRSLPRALVLALAALLIAAAGAGWIAALSVAPRSAWQVSSLAGSPTIAGDTLSGSGQLPLGEWLETGASARARIDVGGIGRVDVEPRSRLRLSSVAAGNYRLRLARGTMHALIWAPPGQFFVDTPASTAIDLGCAYTLQVADDGAGIVEVTSGWVGFASRGRESFIPAGAVCATRPGIGPGTPHDKAVSPAFAAALTTLDFEAASGATRSQAVSTVLAEAQPRDAVTLWHLLRRVDADDRDRVFDRLAGFVPPPDGVTRDGIHAGSQAMADRWWDALGLGSMQVWRHWQQQWRDR